MTEGIARSQPALAMAQALVRRAARHGLPLPDPASGPAPGPAPDGNAALGAQLPAAVAAAEEAGLDAEAELRAACDRYADAVRAAEPGADAVG